jgi:hypothetical protein
MEITMTKVTTIATKPLVERVATILGDDTQRPSTVFADLIAEVDAAIDAADQAGREAREAAANPRIIDHGAMGRAFDFEGLAHKLRNGMQALKQLHRESQLREQLHEWHKLADLVEERAVKLADEMLERYPVFTSWCVDFLNRKAVIDAEVRAVNESAPGYESRRIREIELTARGIEGYGLSVPIERTLKLPALAIDTQAALPLLWPLPQPPISLGMISLFAPNGTPQRDPSRAVLRFEMGEDGVVRKIGLDGQPIEEKPMVQLQPLHEPMSMREQALQEQAERAVEIAKYAEDGRAREAGRQRLNDERDNAEFARRQAAISK